MDGTDPWEKLRKPGIAKSLASCINYDDLAPSLTDNDIITTATANDIQGKVELLERNLCLLQWLTKGQPAKYDVFVCLLHEKGMFGAVKLLRQEPDDEPQLQNLQASGSQPVLHAFGGGDARVPDDCAGVDSAAHKTVGEAGSVEQQVIKATDLKRGEGIYPMVRCSRGKCIIINNRDFECTYKPRWGSDVDVHRMKRLFSALLFKCDVYRNLTAKKMEEVLEAAAKSEEHHDADCLVVILMSHGDRDVIYGIDVEPLHLYNKVYPLFNNENCHALQGKPKLFIVQACRGENRDSGTDMKAASAEAISCKDASPSAAAPKPRMSSFSDMCVIYATFRGHVALRNDVTGSWLLSAVYNVFSQHACTMDLGALMCRVHREVLARAAHDGEKVTPCMKLYGWTSQLFFNPGLWAELGPEETHLTRHDGPVTKRLCC